MTDVLARLRELQRLDVPVTGGRTMAYVYDSGLEEVERAGREAVAVRPHRRTTQEENNEATPQVGPRGRR